MELSPNFRNIIIRIVTTVGTVMPVMEFLVRTTVVEVPP